MKINNYPLICIALIAFFGSSCSVNKAQIDNEIKSFFDEKNVEGCFTMLDNANGGITVYNMSMDTTRFTPGSTFDILHTLIALQVGAVINENTPIYISDTISADTNKCTIKQAFIKNNTDFFGQISKKIGKESFQIWLDSISYGNKKIGENLSSFWMNNSLKISPDEQLGFMKKLYFDQLPFRKSVHLSVRDMMVKEDNSAYKFSYRVGTSINEKHQLVECLVGWIEENRHVYFMANMIQHKNAQSQSEVVNVTKKILEHYGFFKGTK